MSDGQENLGLDEQQAGRVEEYKFEPIKGYPMLNWRGKRPFTSTQFYPAQLKEVHGGEVDGWRNKIFWGDNLQVMSHLLRDFRGSVDLVYIDPPFDSKADYKKNIRIRNKDVAGDTGSFEEKQYSDIWVNDEYLQFMYERIILIHELLRPGGSFYLHCDWHKSHFLRAIVDEIFGKGAFCNEIIWRYRRWSGKSDVFQKMHDNILFFRKRGADAAWNEQREGYSSKTVHRAMSVDGVTPLVQDEERGVAMSDVWTASDDVLDISYVHSQGKERVGYPTQKPEELLRTIISASSNPNDLVFDCFMGSGTTQAVCSELGRRFLGTDINLAAVQITSDRLLKKMKKGDAGFEVSNVNNYDLFRNPVEAKSLLLDALEVQPLDGHNIFDGEKGGRMVKIMPVNRIATKADLGEIVSAFDQKTFQRRQDEKPNQPVEKVLLVCMGHEADLKAELELQAKPFRIDVEVVDILRDKSQLEFKRDSEAKLSISKGELVIEGFYPMNLMQKLSLQQEQVGEWRELVDSVMVDWNYDGAILQPGVVDVPEKNEPVLGRYKIPADSGTIRVKITDLLSESWEGEIDG